MLNEIWRLSQALEKAGVSVESQHPLIKPLPASAKMLLRVRLDHDGHVVAVENVTDDERPGLRRIVLTSDGSFPVLKVNQPILLIREKSPIWRLLKEEKSIQFKTHWLTRCLNVYPQRSWSEAGWRWRDSLRKANLLRQKLDGDDTANPMATVARYFEKALADGQGLLREIATIALEKVAQDRLTFVPAVQELLVGTGKNRNGKDKNISVLLVLDLDQPTSFHEGVYGKQVWYRVANVLPTNLAAKERKHEHAASSSAFGGDGPLLKEPFPQVKLPVLRAYFPLVSMASDDDKAKCNKRYGLTEYTVCPITMEEARRMQDALHWVVTRKEGTTWHGVASGQFKMGKKKKVEKEDLLIVFVDEKPTLDAKTASYLGTSRNDTGAKFEVDTKAVCDALEAVVQEKPTSQLQIFLIRKASDGQAQVALNESPTVGRVLEKADGWQRAARENIPNVTLFLPEDKKNGLSAIPDAQPRPPYLGQVVRLLSYEWVRDGSSPKPPNGKRQKPNHEVVGPGLGDVLWLMLRSEGKWMPTATRMLNLLLARLVPLLIGVFGAKHAYGPRRAQGTPEPLDDYLRDSRETALRAIAVLGILLDALNSRKKEYMNKSTFEIGQVLALADTLHKNYCTVVRKGQLPSSLIGTSLMRRALDNPAAAVGDLGERMIEYVRWAKTTEVSKEWSESDERRIAVYQARKTLRRYEPLASHLGASDLPIECSDVTKAQLLLGFLATPSEEHRDETGKDSTDEH